MNLENTNLRIEERKLQGPPTTKQAAKKIHGESRFARINAKVGLKITKAVGTMYAAYIFAAFALLSLPQAIMSKNMVILVAWLSSNFLQLVLLPIIIVGQNVLAKSADMRSEATFKDAEAVLHESINIQKHLAEQDAHLERQDQIIQKIIKHLEGN